MAHQTAEKTLANGRREWFLKAIRRDQTFGRREVDVLTALLIEADDEGRCETHLVALGKIARYSITQTSLSLSALIEQGFVSEEMTKPRSRAMRRILDLDKLFFILQDQIDA